MGEGWGKGGSRKWLTFLLPPFTKGRVTPLWQRGVRGDFSEQYFFTDLF
jgi:hypothetical protein